MSTRTTGIGVGGIRGMAVRANPAFAVGVVAVPLVALGYAVLVGDLETLTYVHVMAGVLWTGIDVFMGAVLGPVVGGLDTETRADFFERFTPKMTFTMPVLAVVTIAAGVALAVRRGLFPNAEPWMAIFSTLVGLPASALIAYQLRSRVWTGITVVVFVTHAAWLWLTLPALGRTSPLVLFALGVVVVLSIQGFGVILPGEIRIYRQMTSTDPDRTMIGDIGMRNAKLGGLQGVMQLVLIGSMVLLRWS